MVSLAKGGGVKQLYLSHHLPEHTDDDIDTMLNQALALASGSNLVCKAAEAVETVSLSAV